MKNIVEKILKDAKDPTLWSYDDHHALHASGVCIRMWLGRLGLVIKPHQQAYGKGEQIVPGVISQFRIYGALKAGYKARLAGIREKTEAEIETRLRQ